MENIRPILEMIKKLHAMFWLLFIMNGVVSLFIIGWARSMLIKHIKKFH